MKSTFSVPKRNLPWLREQVRKLNLRAKKLGLGELEYSEGEDGIPMEETDPIGGFQVPVPTVVITLDGEAPDVNGWRLSARMHVTDQGNIVTRVPGEDLPDWAKSFIGCQHCNQNRRRKDLFAIIHDTDGTKVVGRTCLQDFFNGSNPQGIIDYAKMVDDILKASKSASNESFYKNDTKYLGFDLFRVLMWVHAEVSVFGFIPSSRERRQHLGDVPTRDFVRSLIIGGTPGSDRQAMLRKEALSRKIDILSTKVVVQVNDLIRWAKVLDASGNDYLHNLQVIARNGFVDWRGMGYVASMFKAHDNAQKRAASAAKVAKAKAGSTHVGTVGEKLSFSGQVVFMRDFDGRYGPTTLIKFVTDEGNAISWFASNPSYSQVSGQCGRKWIEKGDIVSVKGTVKKHDEYKSEKQTTITRAKAERK